MVPVLGLRLVTVNAEQASSLGRGTGRAEFLAATDV